MTYVTIDPLPPKRLKLYLVEEVSGAIGLYIKDENDLTLKPFALLWIEPNGTYLLNALHQETLKSLGFQIGDLGSIKSWDAALSS